MDSELNLVSQKRRVGVDQDLYDFTEEELNFIKRSRLEQLTEDNNPDLAHRNRNVKAKCKLQMNKDNTIRDDMDEPEKYFSTLALDNISCSSKSSMESFQTADSNSYPEPDGLRWADSDSGGGGGESFPNSPSLKRSRSTISNNMGDSECQPELGHFSLAQRKIIVPEAEISDPNFPGLDDSMEETIPSPVKPLNTSLRQKISTFGSFRKGSSGGYFGSYVYRKPSTELETGAKDTNVVHHNGYFRLWFTKFRSSHFL